MVLAGTVTKLLLVKDTGDTQLSYAVTGYQNDPERELISTINSTEKELKIAIYNLDHENIAGAIPAAAARGVSIQIIADGENAANKDSKKILNDLEDLDIPIKIDENNKMHMKLTISDSQTVVTGSFNYTKDSAEDNQEILVTVKDAGFASSMAETFDELWESGSLAER
jgi:phosphatidylserine/phosphatidylglycerophosphate/cardiolipin synthase-like enzyme